MIYLIAMWLIMGSLAALFHLWVLYSYGRKEKRWIAYLLLIGGPISVILMSIVWLMRSNLE